MSSIESVHRERVVGSLAMFDRMIFKGHLRPVQGRRAEDVQTLEPSHQQLVTPPAGSAAQRGGEHHRQARGLGQRLGHSSSTGHSPRPVAGWCSGLVSPGPRRRPASGSSLEPGASRRSRGDDQGDHPRIQPALAASRPSRGSPRSEAPARRYSRPRPARGRGRRTVGAPCNRLRQSRCSASSAVVEEFSDGSVDGGLSQL